MQWNLFHIAKVKPNFCKDKLFSFKTARFHEKKYAYRAYHANLFDCNTGDIASCYKIYHDERYSTFLPYIGIHLHPIYHVAILISSIHTTSKPDKQPLYRHYTIHIFATFLKNFCPISIKRFSFACRTAHTKCLPHSVTPCFCRWL
ncbi:hypothetical protein HMPREF1475_02091 [Hoylesella oralis HGA0225]|nr:hypothetical protein HMPREF1475_02091 [Hoylesella oralis HGA0225]